MFTMTHIKVNNIYKAIYPDDLYETKSRTVFAIIILPDIKAKIIILISNS